MRRSSSFLASFIDPHEEDASVKSFTLDSQCASSVYDYAQSLDQMLQDVVEKLRRVEVLQAEVETLRKQSMSGSAADEGLDVFIPTDSSDLVDDELRDRSFFPPACCADMTVIDPIVTCASPHDCSKRSGDHGANANKQFFESLDDCSVNLDRHVSDLFGTIDFVISLAQQASVYLPALMGVPESYLIRGQNLDCASYRSFWRKPAKVSMRRLRFSYVGDSLFAYRHRSPCPDVKIHEHFFQTSSGVSPIDQADSAGQVLCSDITASCEVSEKNPNKSFDM